MHRVVGWLAAMALAMAGGDARADGMVIGNATDGTVEVRATKQRAVLWLRTSPMETPTWEIHIQPVFDRSRGNAAWVVPFPVRPQVHEGSQKFLDQLNLLTSPVFVDYCTGPFCRCPGSQFDGGVAAAGTTTGGSSSVEIWEQGTVGSLDYVVLSTGSGEDLAEWLEAERYQLPDAAVPLLADYDVEGTFFFVSRLSSTADPALPMTPVRFVLPGLEQGFYPLRLTSLGVGPNERLGLSLWVIFPDPTSSHQVNWLPESHSWRFLVGRDVWGDPLTTTRPTTPESYEEALQEIMTGGALAVTFGGTLADTLKDGGLYFRDDNLEVRVYPRALELDLPSSWSPEIEEVSEERLAVVRYEGMLGPAELAKDLTLTAEEGYTLVQEHSLVYPRYVGTCEGTCPPCRSSGCTVNAAASLARPIPLLLLLLFVARRGRT